MTVCLILGLLMGWIVNRAIESDGWRQCAQTCTIELETLRVQHRRLRADLIADARSLDRIKSELVALQMDNERLRDELNATSNVLSQYHVELAALNSSLSAPPARRSTG